MSGRDDLPDHVAAAPESAQRAWLEAYDAAIEDHGDDDRARAVADAAMAAAGGGDAQT